MLQLSLHFPDEKTATFFNRVGWLYIGYEELDAFSTYKAKMFVVGKSELSALRVRQPLVRADGAGALWRRTEQNRPLDRRRRAGLHDDAGDGRHAAG